MSDFFIQLNSKIYTGFGIYITIITGVMGIYMFMFSQKEILKHQNIMIQYLNSLTQIPIKNLGQRVAKNTLNIIEYIFGKTKHYDITDKSMWNIKIILFYSTLVLLVFFWTIHKWNGNYLNYYFMGIIYIKIIQSYIYSKYKKINLKSEIYKIFGLPFFYIFFLNTFLSILYWIFIYSNDHVTANKILSSFSLLWLSFVYYLYVVLLDIISRVVIYKISIANNIKSLLRNYLLIIIIIIIPFYISYYLSYFIVIFYNLYIFQEYLKNDLNIYLQLIIFITSILPILLLIIIFILEILFRLILYPLQLIIKIFFTFVINRKLYIVLITTLILILLTQYIT